MAVLRFEYRMEIKYEKCVGRCYFTIKCIPREDARQHLLGITLSVLPETEYSEGTDSFGNRQIYGCETWDHDRFVFRAAGDVEILQTDYEDPGDGMTGLYRIPHGKCIPGSGLSEYYRSYDSAGRKSPYEICEAWMHRLHRDFSYMPGVTGVHTTAEEAWNMGKGVCQDYAHIYVTLLRMAGIPARYVCGMIVGEGASHAWAEALCEGRWVAFDPTNDCPVSDLHIKLGHGRDAADCAINRGLMWNGGAQSQKITVLVEKIAKP
ncbi:MAG: transglutaminase family protein [Clostridium sp.]|nr:transglutaminase family protein [Acetatifactor muris]MCM1526167.1 transglutaminase family protein [Bacteroides sp.]MCM1562685.1 transglutaminase family protein [Clostridium sp.]